MSLFVNGIRLSVQDERRLKNAAKIAQAIENKFDLEVRRAIETHADTAVDQVTGPMPVTAPDFEKILIEHYFQTAIAAFRICEDERELTESKPRLAKARSLKEILRQYDSWRKGFFKPKRPLKQADGLKKRYIDAVQKAWKKHSDDFREGGRQTQDEIRDLIRKEAQTVTLRAQTIVRTETTRYYNRVRRDYYDASQDVTHYLFLAVRDRATTPWCRNSYQLGKRGRSGLVYAKGDPLLEKETPPVHWNCRSELLPLNRFNPSHQRLIADASIQRRNHECTPLPPEWHK